MKTLVPLLMASFLVFATAAAAQDNTTGNIRYVDATMQNVSDVLFRKDILRTQDPAAIEEYIRLHECGLYEQYANDDIAWARLREAYARNMELHMNELPEGVEIVSGLQLGQYDIVNAEFPIAQDSQMDNMGLVSVVNTEGGMIQPCGEEGVAGFVPRLHPLKLTVKIDKPITLKAIPLTGAKADKLIADMNKRIVALEMDRRKVTLVLRVRLMNADPLTGVTDPLRRAVVGLIDDLRIYEGPNRQELLYRVDYLAQREKSLKK